MRKAISLLILFLPIARAASPALSLPVVSASNPPHGLDYDLGQGLAYHRVHQLPADLPTAESARKQPCVLDLRYVRGDATDATALSAWLRFHATPRTPVFILANPSTSAELLSPFTVRGSSIVVIGPAAPGFTPDIALKISPDADRRAYDALEHGAALASLLNDTPDKPRNDEAKLAKERTADSAPGGDNLVDDKPAPSALIDAALQRAVHLHRALVALQRI